MNKIAYLLDSLKSKVDRLPKEANWFDNVDHIKYDIELLEKELEDLLPNKKPAYRENFSPDWKGNPDDPLRWKGW